MMRCETGIGYSADFSKIRMEQHPDVYVTSQEWLLYEMGIINIPNMQYRYQNTQLPESAGEGQISFILGAARISGTMELRCDEWILIPYEHFLYVTEMDHEGSEQIAVTLTHEDDTVESIGSDLAIEHSTRTVQIYEMGLNNWTYPRDGGRLVVAFNSMHPTTDVISHVDTNSLSIGLEVFRRWKSFR
jgi:hypothetical protein